MGNSEKRGKSLELELDDRDGIFVFFFADVIYGYRPESFVTMVSNRDVSLTKRIEL